MNPRRIASVAAVAGAAGWLVKAVLAWLGAGGAVTGVLFVLGLVALVVALAAAGYTLVETAPAWLRGVVVVAMPALVLLVWQMLDQAVQATLGGSQEPSQVSVLLGAVVALALGLWGRRRFRAEPGRRAKPGRRAEPGRRAAPEEPARPVRGRRAAR
jgi:hypothetical protein